LLEDPPWKVDVPVPIEKKEIQPVSSRWLLDCD